MKIIIVQESGRFLSLSNASDITSQGPRHCAGSVFIPTLKINGIHIKGMKLQYDWTLKTLC